MGAEMGRDGWAWDPTFIQINFMYKPIQTRIKRCECQHMGHAHAPMAVWFSYGNILHSEETGTILYTNAVTLDITCAMQVSPHLLTA